MALRHARWLVVGSSGGIGRAVVAELQRRGAVSVVGVSRSGGGSGDGDDGVDSAPTSTAVRTNTSFVRLGVDVATDAASVEDGRADAAVAAAVAAARLQLRGAVGGEEVAESSSSGHSKKMPSFDACLCCVGELGTAPERRGRDLRGAALARAMRLNAALPLLFAAHVLEDRKVAAFGALSARVGSVADNELGGWLSYRASKAALNQGLRTLAIEHGRYGQRVLALHPGTVDTALSEAILGAPDSPRRRAYKHTVLAPDEAAKRLVALVDGTFGDVVEADGGAEADTDHDGFVDWRGTRIPW